MAGNPPLKTAAASPAPASYVVTNDDATALLGQNSISFFQAGGSPLAPSLTYQTTLYIGGAGIGGGFFGSSRLTSLPDSGAHCLYVSDSGSGAVVAVNLQTQQVAGTFSGSENDTGTSNGIGLAMNGSYLYASFTDSNTIGTFAVLPGCQLNYVNSVTVGGLNGGTIYAMAVSGSILVATYADGSIESFNISAGTPAPNGDQQNSTGYVNDYNNLPDGVDITQDGRYAIFGDAAIRTVVEVSDISSGKLKPTSVYQLGVGPVAVGPIAVVPGVNSSNVRLSPDESLLFISNNQSGNVTAGFFDPTTGAVSPGCTSPSAQRLLQSVGLPGIDGYGEYLRERRRAVRCRVWGALIDWHPDGRNEWRDMQANRVGQLSVGRSHKFWRRIVDLGLSAAAVLG